MPDKPLVSMLVAVALLASSAHAETIPGVADDDRLIVVSLGDSFASGEGNPDVPRSDDGAARWFAGAGAATCHRSLRNAHRLAFGELAAAWRQADPGRAADFVSFACGGASVTVGLLGAQAPQLGPACPQGATAPACGSSQMTQLRDWTTAQGLASGDIDILLLSIGGNDLGLSELMQKAATSPPLLGRQSFTATDNTVVGARLLSLRANLGRAIRTINTRFAPKAIVLVGYPDPLRDRNGGFCNEYVDPTGGGIGALIEGALTQNVTREETRFASRVVLNPLNRELARAVAIAPNVMLVDTLPEGGQRATNGYCADARRAFHTFGDSQRIQGDMNSALHPNASGTRMIADRIVAALLRSVAVPLPVRTPIATPPRVAPSAVDPSRIQLLPR